MRSIEPLFLGGAVLLLSQWWWRCIKARLANKQIGKLGIKRK